jgi:hypothetical protein
MQDRSDHLTVRAVQAFRGINRSKYLREIGPMGIKPKADLIGLAQEAMGAARQTVTIHLEPVPKPGLHHPLVLFNLVDQAMQIGNQIGVHTGNM